MQEGTIVGFRPDSIRIEDRRLEVLLVGLVGFNATKSSSQHVVPIGKLRDIKLMNMFGFKVWWL